MPQATQLVVVSSPISKVGNLTFLPSSTSKLVYIGERYFLVFSRNICGTSILKFFQYSLDVTECFGATAVRCAR